MIREDEKDKDQAKSAMDKTMALFRIIISL
jgi:hypothetical protein